MYMYMYHVGIIKTSGKCWKDGGKLHVFSWKLPLLVSLKLIDKPLFAHKVMSKV